jgi:hypothetical protein
MRSKATFGLITSFIAVTHTKMHIMLVIIHNGIGIFPLKNLVGFEIESSVP